MGRQKLNTAAPLPGQHCAGWLQMTSLVNDDGVHMGFFVSNISSIFVSIKLDWRLFHASFTCFMVCQCSIFPVGSVRSFGNILVHWRASVHMSQIGAWEFLLKTLWRVFLILRLLISKCLLEVGNSIAYQSDRASYTLSCHNGRFLPFPPVFFLFSERKLSVLTVMKSRWVLNWL